jgi:hypothetical protein
VAQRMVKLHRERGWEHFILAVGDMAPEKIERSMRLMAEEVIPRVRSAVGAEVTVAAGE